jgi:hypothetical protein
VKRRPSPSMNAQLFSNFTQRDLWPGILRDCVSAPVKVSIGVGM